MSDKVKRDWAVDEFVSLLTNQLKAMLANRKRGERIGPTTQEVRAMIVEAAIILYESADSEDAIALGVTCCRLMARTKKFDGLRQVMVARFDQKAAEGYTGWDSVEPIEALLDCIFDDAILIEHRGEDEKAVDVMNRCMIVWYRSKAAS